MDFESLIGHINQVHDSLQTQASHAVNLSLTARNWLVGYYIVEFEQQGEDRAKYGDNLLRKLAHRLNRRGLGERRLYEFRQTYSVYPQMGRVIADYLSRERQMDILRLTTAKCQKSDFLDDGKLRLPTAKSHEEEWSTPAERLFYRLSATHLVYLSNIKEPLKRAFYEQEAIRECWTLKELDRQVSSLYFERMGLSKDKMALRQYVANETDRLQPSDIIRNPVSKYQLLLPSEEELREYLLENITEEDYKEYQKEKQV